MQCFLMPSQGNGTHNNPFRPKYTANLNPNPYSFKFAQQPLFFVADNLTLLQQAALLTAALLPGDLLGFPEDLDTELSVVDDILPLFEGGYESRVLTADWMTAGMTYRTCARRCVLGEMSLAMRMLVLGESLFSIPYANNISTYSTNARQAFYDACDYLSLDRTAVLTSDTLRQAIAKVIPSVDGTTLSCGGFGDI